MKLENYGGDANEICRKVAEQPETSSGTYKKSSKITGQCKSVGVNLEADSGATVRTNFEIVWCDLGSNYRGCASASTDDGVIEYYTYESKKGVSRCIHQGSFSL